MEAESSRSETKTIPEASFHVAAKEVRERVKILDMTFNLFEDHSDVENKLGVALVKSGHSLLSGTRLDCIDGVYSCYEHFNTFINVAGKQHSNFGTTMSQNVAKSFPELFRASNKRLSSITNKVQLQFEELQRDRRIISKSMEKCIRLASEAEQVIKARNQCLLLIEKEAEQAAAATTTGETPAGGGVVAAGGPVVAPSAGEKEESGFMNRSLNVMMGKKTNSVDLLPKCQQRCKDAIRDFDTAEVQISFLVTKYNSRCIEYINELAVAASALEEIESSRLSCMNDTVSRVYLTGDLMNSRMFSVLNSMRDHLNAWNMSDEIQSVFAETAPVVAAIDPSEESVKEDSLKTGESLNVVVANPNAVDPCSRPPEEGLEKNEVEKQKNGVEKQVVSCMAQFDVVVRVLEGFKNLLFRVAQYSNDISEAEKVAVKSFGRIIDKHGLADGPTSHAMMMNTFECISTHESPTLKACFERIMRNVVTSHEWHELHVEFYSTQCLPLFESTYRRVEAVRKDCVDKQQLHTKRISEASAVVTKQIAKLNKVQNFLKERRATMAAIIIPPASADNKELLSPDGERSSISGDRSSIMSDSQIMSSDLDAELLLANIPEDYATTSSLPAPAAPSTSTSPPQSTASPPSTSVPVTRRKSVMENISSSFVSAGKLSFSAAAVLSMKGETTAERAKRIEMKIQSLAEEEEIALTELKAAEKSWVDLQEQTVAEVNESLMVVKSCLMTDFDCAHGMFVEIVEHHVNQVESNQVAYSEMRNSHQLVDLPKDMDSFSSKVQANTSPQATFVADSVIPNVPDWIENGTIPALKEYTPIKIELIEQEKLRLSGLGSVEEGVGVGDLLEGNSERDSFDVVCSVLSDGNYQHSFDGDGVDETSFTSGIVLEHDDQDKTYDVAGDSIGETKKIRRRSLSFDDASRKESPSQSPTTEGHNPSGDATDASQIATPPRARAPTTTTTTTVQTELVKFGLSPADKILESFTCAFYPKRGILTHGRLFVTQHFAAFAGWDGTRVLLALLNIASIEKMNSLSIVPNAFQISMTSKDEYFFGSFLNRDMCHSLLTRMSEVDRHLYELHADESTFSFLNNKEFEFGIQSNNKENAAEETPVNASVDTVVVSAAATASKDATASANALPPAATTASTPAKTMVSSVPFFGKRFAKSSNNSTATAAAPSSPVKPESAHAEQSKEVAGTPVAVTTAGYEQKFVDDGVVLTPLAGTHQVHQELVPYSIDCVWQHIFKESAGFYDFLDGEGDSNIKLTEWKKYPEPNFPEDAAKLPVRCSRDCEFLHMRTSMLMFGDKYAPAVQVQYLYFCDEDGKNQPVTGENQGYASLRRPCKFSVVTLSAFDKLPMADVFRVVQYFSFEPADDGKGGKNWDRTQITISANVHFVKYTMLKTQMRQGTYEELTGQSKSFCAYLIQSLQNNAADTKATAEVELKAPESTGVPDSPKPRRPSIRRSSFSAAPQPPPSSLPFGLSENHVVIGLSVVILLLLLYIVVGRWSAPVVAPSVDSAETSVKLLHAITQLQERMDEQHAVMVQMSRLMAKE